MLEEFCQAPLCLELDLDSYEGDWSHVARFRGRSGWILAANATLESATDIFRTTIVAACDEQDHPIPAFQAAHLLECTWSDLRPCSERPPEILDELLCEEEGRVYARWQRENNVALRQHLNAIDDQIAAVEAGARVATDRLLRQIDELRRRRRLPGLTVEARSIFDTLIAEIEAENDRTFEWSRERVAQIRAEAERREEGLWQGEDVLIEVEPLYLIAWRALEPAHFWRPNPCPAVPAPAEAMRTVLRHQIPARIRELERRAEPKRPHQWHSREVAELDREIRRLYARLKKLG